MNQHYCKVGIEAGDPPVYWIESPWTGNIIKLPIDRTFDDQHLAAIRVKIRAAILLAYDDFHLDREPSQVGRVSLTIVEMKEWQQASQ